MEEEKTAVARPQFHSITKVLAMRTIVMTRQQPLCTKTVTLKMIFGHVCERKGASDTWVIGKIKEDIALGYQDVSWKGAGEPALVQVLENVKTCARSTLHNPAFTNV